MTRLETWLAETPPIQDKPTILSVKRCFFREVLLRAEDFRPKAA